MIYFAHILNEQYNLNKWFWSNSFTNLNKKKQKNDFLSEKKVLYLKKYQTQPLKKSKNQNPVKQDFVKLTLIFFNF